MITLSETWMGEKELRYITNYMKNGIGSRSNNEIIKFEKELSKFCGAKYAIATTSGTTALHLALATLGIVCGDEVIIPVLTRMATANAVTYTGAKPVFVDVTLETWTIDPNLIEEKITERTKAIIPVHLYGHPAHLDTIKEIARVHNLYVIEDATEALGAEYKGEKVGSLGDIGCFSFNNNGIISTEEGGMLITNNEKLAQRARLLSDEEALERENYPGVGYNYRMTNLQAAIGLAQLERIDITWAIKIDNARKYNSVLKGIKGIGLFKEAKWARSIYWLYSVLIEEEFRISRDRLIKVLRENGIESRPLYSPLHLQAAYSKFSTDRFPVAESLAKRGLSLPSSALLKVEEIMKIAELLRNIQEGKVIAG